MRISSLKQSLVMLLLLALPVAGFATSARAADKDARSGEMRTYQQQLTAALDYLSTKGQAEDGSFSAQDGPAVTAIVATGLIKNGRSLDEPMVAKALKYVQKYVHDDGGIYTNGSRHQNYETCVALIAFHAANADHRYDELIKNAEKFLRGIQWDESKDITSSSEKYGGAGYGGPDSRPDLSNTSFLVDALKANGAGPDDEALKRALIFVSRCQNLESASNTTPFPAKNPDGGFYYTPAAGGSSEAGKTANGGLRSYGSMTYSGLRSMIYAGVKADDPRVKAAFKWAQDHYTLAENPGMGAAGLFYYYHTLAKALAAMNVDKIKDKDGKEHDWRQEMIEELGKRQRPDGSWVNDTPRWLEGNTNLVTGYVLLTLSYCKPAK